MPIVLYTAYSTFGLYLHLSPFISFIFFYILLSPLSPFISFDLLNHLIESVNNLISITGDMRS